MIVRKDSLDYVYLFMKPFGVVKAVPIYEKGKYDIRKFRNAKVYTFDENELLFDVTPKEIVKAVKQELNVTDDILAKKLGMSSPSLDTNKRMMQKKHFRSLVDLLDIERKAKIATLQKIIKTDELEEVQGE